MESQSAARRASLVILSSLVVASCASPPPPAAPPAPVRVAPAPVAEPVEIGVQARRLGESVRVDIVGIGRELDEGQALEDPARWRVSANAAGRSLQRVVNGPVRVAREPVGSVAANKWDVTVSFSVVFSCPEEHDEVEVVVLAPQSTPVRTRIGGL